jgi:hypothetical protein
VLVGRLKRDYPTTRPFQLVCLRELILNIFRITGRLILVCPFHSFVDGTVTSSE